ncbi:DUF6292 family protein [Spirillospora sp. NPDC029432]|uniref:DUF6292 family protein n=1 Tax=Spirillospora sp. NPDC029432 TaxID=3154599 RepID=UPI0034543490
MSDSTLPARHEDPALDLLRPYITASARALQAAGIELERSWLDPSGPRDATIVCRLEGETRALVWDEETGWRIGGFVSGRPGERTRLADARYLGQEVLPLPQAVADAVVTGSAHPRRKFRSHSDDTESFDAEVRQVCN